MVLFRSIILLLISVFAASKTNATPKLQNFSIKTGGNIGISHIINNRIISDVSKTGSDIGGRIEFQLPNILPMGGLSFNLSLNDIFLPGSATVFSTTGSVKYISNFTLLGKIFNFGFSLGADFNIAPTRDDSSTWYGFNFRADLRTYIFKYEAGLYIKYQQLVMSDVEDPIFITGGLEFIYELWSSHQRVEPIQHKTMDKKPKISTPVVDPNDLDGDGITNIKDRCPSSIKGARVETSGCRPISDGMVFKGLEFIKDKPKLKKGSAKYLKALFEILKASPNISIVIIVQAKTAVLAKKRADILEMSLKNLGIKGKRITTSPITGDSSTISFNFRLLL